MPPKQVNASAAGQILLGGELTVNRFGFGALHIAGRGSWGEPPDVDEAKRTLRRALELGVNFIDTADSYGPEISERLIAETLHPYPQGLVISTKGGMVRPDARWETDGRPEHLRIALEGSLARLRLERIDLYHFHRPDPKVPFEESLGTLVQLRDEGKIRLIGVSNVSIGQLEQAISLTPISSVQNQYNHGFRKAEDVLRRCESLGIAYQAWQPVGGLGSTPFGDAVESIARERGLTPRQIALAWLLARSPMIMPIPGTSSVAHLEENLAAARVQLEAAELERLEIF